jgi:hypothetical protein
MAAQPEKPKKPGDYEVGYGKPPEHTQFQKGQPSRNPKGRPKKDRSHFAELRREFEASLNVTGPDGRKKAMSAIQVLARQLIQDGLKQDKAARKEALQLYRDIARLTGEAPRTETQIIREAEQEAERQKKAKELAAWINDLLEFAADAKKSGILELKDGKPNYGPIAGAVAAYVEATCWPSQTPESEARAALLAALDLRLAERIASKPGGPVAW